MGGKVRGSLARFACFYLLGSDFAVVDAQNVDVVLVVRVHHILVHADDGLLEGIDPGLLLGGCLFDDELGSAGVDVLGHAAHFLDLVDQRPRALVELVGERLHHVTASPRVDNVGDSRLLLKDDLRVSRDPSAELGGQSQSFVEGVRVQRLGAPHDGRHGLDRGAHHVVVRILLGQAVSTGLAVRPEHARHGVLRLEVLLHEVRPQAPGRAKLRHLGVEVHAHRKEEAEARCHLVHVQASLYRAAYILDSVCQRERQLDHGVRARLLHVVPTDADAVVERHVLGRESKDVLDDPHARLRRVDVRVAHHELLQDVVLDRAAELLQGDAALLGSHDVEGQHGEHRAVHGHRDAHLVQRNLVKEHLHVLHRVYGDASHANIADHALVVAVEATMRRQVEGHAEALLAGAEVALVELVALLRGAESGVLPNRPGSSGVHRRVRAARVRCHTCGVALRSHAIRHVLVGVQRLHQDALGRASLKIRHRLVPQLFPSRFQPRRRVRASGKCATTSYQPLKRPGDAKQRRKRHAVHEFWREREALRDSEATALAATWILQVRGVSSGSRSAPEQQAEKEDGYEGRRRRTESLAERPDRDSGICLLPLLSAAARLCTKDVLAGEGPREGACYAEVMAKRKAELQYRTSARA
eukprot:scaffold1492_cov257-Pinguiococcus_pyrenoidosus.AAC.8